jgi:hypothetical protein
MISAVINHQDVVNDLIAGLVIPAFFVGGTIWVYWLDARQSSTTPRYPTRPPRSPSSAERPSQASAIHPRS